MTSKRPNHVGKDRLAGVLDLVDQIRDEAAMASRAGQSAVLYSLADDLEVSIRDLASENSSS